MKLFLGLTLLAIVGIEDPVREEVCKAFLFIIFLQ